MYWWNIKALKKELLAGPLSEAKIFPYLLASTIVVSLMLIPVTGEWVETQLDVYNALIGVVITALGTYYAYRCNGGATGKNFLQHYFSLGWVVGIRLGVMVMIPAFLLLFLVLAAQEGYTGATTWGDIIFITLLSLFYFWRLGKHIKDVATGGSTTEVSASTESAS